MRGSGQVVVPSGEAGIGKMRLIATAKARASASHAGYVVLDSSCFEPDRMVPYTPLIDMLRDSMSTEIAQALHSAAPGLVRVVPELSVRVPGLVRSTPLEPDHQRHGLFRTVSKFLLDLTRARPVLLLVEDLCCGTIARSTASTAVRSSDSGVHYAALRQTAK